MYSRIVFFTLFLFCIFSTSYAQIGIGTTVPNSSSILDVSSNSKGFLMPRMTEAERDNISNPAVGLMVYCTDCCTDGTICFYSDQWTTVIECSGPVAPETIEIPSGNFDSGGNGGFAQHESDVSYPSLFNGDSINDNNRFHEGDYIDITFSTPSNPVVLPADCKVKVYWYHNGDNRSWGVYTTFYTDNTAHNTVNDGPISGVTSERVLVATTTETFNKIRVGAISTGVGGYDARIREIDVIKPDGSEITITIN